MKTLSTQHRELAIQYFEAYPGEDVLHISLDGQVFLNANKNDAANHQRSLSPGEPLVTVSRKELGAYAPAFDYDSMTDEEKAVYDENLKAIEEENQKEELIAKILELSPESEEYINAELKGRSIDELNGIIQNIEAIKLSETNKQGTGQDLSTAGEGDDVKVIVEGDVVPTTDATMEDLKTPDTKKPKADKKVIKK